MDLGGPENLRGLRSKLLILYDGGPLRQLDFVCVRTFRYVKFALMIAQATLTLIISEGLFFCLLLH
jgi:hypothetical protein